MVAAGALIAARFWTKWYKRCRQERRLSVCGCLPRCHADRRLSLSVASWTRVRPQHDGKSGAPSAQVYCAEIGSIRLGTLFFHVAHPRAHRPAPLLFRGKHSGRGSAPLGPPADRVIALTAASRSVL